MKHRRTRARTATFVRAMAEVRAASRMPSQEEFDRLVAAGVARDDAEFAAWQQSR